MSCKTINIDLANVPPVPLQIGVAGENAFRTITFDASKWGADYPGATYTVVYRRSDGYLYPVFVNASADAIVWNPTGTDTAVSGNGQLEVRLLDGETIGKTIIMQTYVAPSLSGDESEPSTPEPDWVNDVADDADRAEAAVSHYPKIVNGYWWVWDVESGEWVNTGVKATGEGGTAADAVLYTAQSLTDAQKSQARTNVGAGTYSKPSGGIPASDLAPGVIPDVSGKANAADVYTKTEVDQKLVGAMDYKGTKATVSELPTSGNNTGDVWHVDADGSEWAWNGSTWEELGTAVDLSGYATEQWVENKGYLTQHQSLAAYRTSAAQDTIDAGKLDTTGNAYRSASIPMGECDDSSTATVFTATVPGITELRDGVCMWLQNGVITSASGFTLNVNGLGAKPCYSSLAAASRSTTIFNVNYTMLFVYNSTRVDGGCWDIVYGVDTNTTYTPPKLGFGYGTCTTAAATAAKTASISSYALTAGGIVSIKFDNDVPANATLNITSKGAKAIYYRGAAITAGVIKAGDTATFVYSTYYHLISIDRDESGDDLPSVTASDNGKFLRVVSGAWAAQAVPSAESNSFGGGA